MDKEFIPYEQALELRELDFNEECLALYYVPTKGLHYGPTKELITQYTEDVRIVAPTFSQAFRWFREEYGYDVTIKKCTPSEYKFEIEQLFVKGDSYYFIDFPFTSYEEAELKCLKKLIEIAKQK